MSHLESREALAQGAAAAATGAAQTPHFGAVGTNGRSAAPVRAELQRHYLTGVRRDELSGVCQQVPHTRAVVS